MGKNLFRAVVAVVAVTVLWVVGCTASGNGNFDGSACAGGETQCAGKCVDVQSDLANCGACGTACKTGEVCSQGACATSCGGGTTKCGATCNDTQNDPKNCGACGTACKSGEYCSAGKCTSTCSGTVCGSSCVDTNVDSNNCGACGTKCGAGLVCNAGTCSLGCGAATLCGGDGGSPYCAQTQTDNANCGTCGNACGTGQVCSGGKCGSSCGGGDGGTDTLCTPDGGTPYCANTASDNANCGSCGNACNKFQVCSAGTCGSGCAGKDGGTQTLCTPDAGSPYCADTQNDTNNCGSCGNVCKLGLGCSGGTCKVINGESEIPISTSMMVGTSYTGCSLTEFAGGSVSTTCPTLAGFKWTDAANLSPTSLSFTIDASWTCNTPNSTVNVMLNGTVSGTLTTSGAGCTCTPGTNVRTVVLTSLSAFSKNATNTITFATISTAACDSYQANSAWGGLFGYVHITY